MKLQNILSKMAFLTRFPVLWIKDGWYLCFHQPLLIYGGTFIGVYSHLLQFYYVLGNPPV